MRENKYRIPVECQNGHKAFWYCRVSNTEICEYDGVMDGFTGGVPREQKCSCPKIGFGEGYHRVGDNQWFTGLKDKNGVEIYEGDVLAWFDGKVAVEWSDEDAMFHSGIETHGHLAFIPPQDDIEVIGNIHEHPDLME